jgi:hypothetical protein
LKFHYRVYWLEDLGVYGRIILKCSVRKWDEDVDWIHLGIVAVLWRAPDVIVMNFSGQQNAKLSNF